MGHCASCGKFHPTNVSWLCADAISSFAAAPRSHLACRSSTHLRASSSSPLSAIAPACRGRSALCSFLRSTGRIYPFPPDPKGMCGHLRVVPSRPDYERFPRLRAAMAQRIEVILDGERFYSSLLLVRARNRLRLVAYPIST